MTVIRDAVIRIRTERSGQVGGGYESRAFSAEARAAADATREVGRHREAIQRTREEVIRYEGQSIRSYSQIGRGLLELGRGVGFMAAATEEDAMAIIKTLAAVEAGVFAVKGGVEAAKGLSSVLGAGATTAIAYASGVTGAFIALDYFSESSRRARRELEEFNQIKEHSLKLSRMEADALRERSLVRNEQRGIDRDIAMLGSPASQVAGLAAFGAELAKDRSNAARGEGFARNRLAAMDRGEAPEKFRGETMQQLLDAEMRQQEALRREIQNGRDLEAARIRQIEDQQATIRSRSPFSAFGSFGKAAEDAAIAGLERQKTEITEKSASILRELLESLRAQAEQVSQVKRDLQALER